MFGQKQNKHTRTHRKKKKKKLLENIFYFVIMNKLMRCNRSKYTDTQKNMMDWLKFGEFRGYERNTKKEHLECGRIN